MLQFHWTPVRTTNENDSASMLGGSNQNVETNSLEEVIGSLGVA
jgi:hypothetical protein